MPNLEEFQAGPGKIDVSDRGAESFAQAGRRAGVAFNQMGQDTEKTYNVFHAHQVDMDVGNTLTAQSTAEVNAHNQLMTLVNDPRAADHPELGQQLIEQYTQAQNDIWSHASTEEGRRAGQRVAAERIDQFSQRVASEMATLAGGKAAQNLDTYANNSAAMGADDPSRLVNLLDDLKTHFDQIAPHNLTAEGVVQHNAALTRAQEKVAMASYLSGIHTGENQIASGQPGAALDAVQKMLDSGVGMDVLGDSKAALQDKIDEARRVGAERFKVGQGADIKADADAAKGEMAQARTLMLPDENGNIDPAKEKQAMQIVSTIAARHPRGSADLVGEISSFGEAVQRTAEERISGKFATDDSSTVADINQRRSIAPGQPGALTQVQLDDMRSSGRLSQKTYEEQSRRLKDLTDNPALRETESRLTGFIKESIWPAITQGDTDISTLGASANLFTSKVDPAGRAAAGIALNQTIAQFEAMVQNGTPPDTAYKILTDQSSPGSVWHVVKAWQAYAQQGPAWAAQHPTTFGNPGAAGAGEAPPPTPGLDASVAKVQSTGAIKPGESWAAYKKRAGL